jgi:transcription-repair coupling factor (superfamily II helicase)
MPLDLVRSKNSLQKGGTAIIANVPDGFKGNILGNLASAAAAENYRGLVYVASDGQEIPQLLSALEFFAPELQTLQLPAWDCLPYDRVSPSSEIMSRRIAAFNRLETANRTSPADKPLLVVTTVNAMLQRMVPLDEIAAHIRRLAPGNNFTLESILHWLTSNGFERTSTVRERGEYAIRGGIVDLFVPGSEHPVRLDFFGDTLESIRTFDVASQRSLSQLPEITLAPMSEIRFDSEAISRFRSNYIRQFGAAKREDTLYESISEGRRYAGMEHWLPLFHENLSGFFEIFDGYAFATDHNVISAAKARREQIEEHFQARKSAEQSVLESGTPYNPVAPDSLYLTLEEVDAGFAGDGVTILSPFMPAGENVDVAVNIEGHKGHSFAAERAAGINVFDKVVEYINGQIEDKCRIVVACWTQGARTRMQQVLQEHGLKNCTSVASFNDIASLKIGQTGFSVLPLESGFSVPGLVFVAEQDILGDRLVRQSTRKRKSSDFISELTALSEGDIVVHVEHGIARFAGLKTIEAAGAPHDCLELRYQGDDRLFLPVENIELLSRYGSADSEVTLDRLGGTAWQSRKAKLKKRILEMADQLIRIAAERALRRSERLTPADGLFDEFVARFPYDETEDQLAAIEAVLSDLASETPMDRLICGDVGFGKTEVALRAAFVAAMSGKQVAVVVPTTLLARQHFNTFQDRFRDFPVEVRQASRLVPQKELIETRKAIADGSVDIVIGTHALLAESVKFARLGLLIIDEEQRFGVKHKERLKEMKSDVHVLTLSATPIPRTLQLALTGVRELSLIATAPVDRLAVRTFITPFDTLAIREALLRERYRGGQSFYVCPRVSDLGAQQEFLAKHVPELKVAVAHGQMPPRELDDVMNAFYERKYDILLSTTIVESGLDIPTANTLIVYRADMFGLAQLYQLRGRVGRSKNRAYAIFTLPVRKTLTTNAERRLKVLQSLDSIGAGFELASHDLDIRGSGNLLGEEQSGQIREVGYELYQQMLEEAVAELKQGDEQVADRDWSPQITIGTPVLIPESYVADLQLRLGLYRRLASLREAGEIDAFGAEMIDRFGPLPTEVDHLLKIVYVKGLCFRANIERLDAGPKGVVIAFRDKIFANPAALVKWIGEQSSLAKIRPDQSIVVNRDWATPEKRLQGAASIVQKLARMAETESVSG